MLAVHKYTLAYENWCWSSYAPTWDHAWDVVKNINKPNVGLCLDTFQIAGSEWADPTTASGISEISGLNSEWLKTQSNKSLKTLVEEVPKDKIFFLQISDAYRMSLPLKSEKDEPGLDYQRNELGLPSLKNGDSTLLVTLV